MKEFRIEKKHTPTSTERVEKVRKFFDLQGEDISEVFEGQIDLDFDWNIGLIVGDSGTGKSTLMRELFPEHSDIPMEFNNPSVIDDFPQDKDIDQITKTMVSVGFSSPPSWLKPYEVLSMGEQMRVELAMSLLQDREIIVFDEYTSVVDRITAKITSELFSKKIRKMNKKFVGISCHKDIIDTMNPDWIFDTNKMEFTIPEKKKSNTNYQYTLFQTENSKKSYGKNLVNIII